MIHSKSKSTKIKEKEEDQNINTVVNIKTNRFNNNNSLTLNSIDLTKENLNLKLITSEKISNLLYDSENDDKVVNISKLDEELYTDEKRIKKYDKNVTVGSDFELVIGNINENDTSKPIINISSLDTPIHLQNEIQTINLVNNNNVSTSNTSINNNIINNDNNNLINNKEGDKENQLPSYEEVHGIDINKIAKQKNEDGIEVIEYHEKIKMKFDQQECLICIGEFENGEKLSILECNHCYHESCLKDWIKKVKGIFCPLCQASRE